MGHNVQASAEYIMKTEQLSEASSDNRARTKWWIFPSEVVWRREGRWVPIEANGNGVECFVPPCAPPPPPTSPLCPHPHILIHSASHLLCRLLHNPLDLYRTVCALDLGETRSKSRSLQMGEFRAARLAGALFELVQLELFS